MQQRTEFGRWLKQRRKSLDLTQQELATHLGYALDTLVKIETGSRQPSRNMVDRLADCLQIPPAARTAFADFARGRIAVPPALLGPPAPSLAAGTNLPAPLTSFVGRAAEVQAVQGLLQRPAVRLLTLTGPPGIGKTRLALQVAAAVAPVFAHGVYFVPLAAIRDPDAVAPAIARTLGLWQTGAQPLIEQLRSYLRRRSLLLVLDNYEQVRAAAPLVTDLLAAAPGLKVLATSRLALQLYGEHDLLLTPLPLPPDPSAPPGQLETYPAVVLFYERALAARADFALTAENAAPVAAVCRYLGGLPLALELAAAQVKTYPPVQILARLSDSAEHLAVLSASLVDREARQQTLGNAIAWSYDLLGTDEQALFRHLGVFVGGCDLAATEAVAGERDGGIGAGLETLVAHSLVQRHQAAGETIRYTLLEPIRAYALERLGEAGELAAAQARHAAYYLARAEEARAAFDGPDLGYWLDYLEREHDNLRAALRWAAAQESPSIQMRLVAALAKFWRVRGYWQESRTQLDAALARGGPAWGAGTYAWLLREAGLIAQVQGDNAQGRAWLDAALSLFREYGDRSGEAAVLRDSAYFMVLEYNPAVIEQLETARDLAAQAGDQNGVAEAVGYHAFVLFQQQEQGREVQPEPVAQQALALYQALGNPLGIADVFLILGQLARQAGDLETAARHYEESLRIYQALGEKDNSARTLYNLSSITRTRQDYSATRRHLEACRQLFDQLGSKQPGAWTLFQLARLNRIENTLDGAEALLAEAQNLFQALNDQRGLAFTLEEWGHQARVAGQMERAATLLGAAAVHYAAAGFHRQQADLETYAFDQMATDDGPRFRTGWEAGRRLSLEDALAYAQNPPAAESDPILPPT